MTDNAYKRKLKKHFKSLGYTPEFIKQAIPRVMKLAKDLESYSKDIPETIKALNEAK